MIVIPMEDAMMSIVQARVRVIRLYLAEVEEGKVDYWRLIRVVSGILIGAWILYAMMLIRSLA